ncbi:unnamed protein product [Nippostrongylus brasiliensis]|uniref:DUF1794 domain-containing protein n=1 Tax=Nippostrongylus brasiliensis TaxID=27835 RepID=A0A0N4YDE0_NIPBR|nr:unnamed protein product [Nippostrongylus brasiliensis]
MSRFGHELSGLGGSFIEELHINRLHHEELSQIVRILRPARKNTCCFPEIRNLRLEYDLRRLPSTLQPISFLIGKWRSEHGGKAIFPTIPKFTYGEEVDISIPDDALQARRALNYTYDDFFVFRRIYYFTVLAYIRRLLNARTGGHEEDDFSAFAWSINEKDELHSESGYISVKPNTKDAALTTVMNNGECEDFIFGSTISF